MMLQIHPQARTTPAVRADIARSSEPTSVLARRYGISDETVRKWRRRGSDACQDRSSRPRKLVWKASEEERAIICQLRRSTAQTNGMVERFNGRVATEVLQICVSCHDDLEILLRGFCFAYNHRPQPVLAGITPAKCITLWLEKHPASRNPDYIKPDHRDIMKQVDEILDYANDVSQPDS